MRRGAADRTRLGAPERWWPGGTASPGLEVRRWRQLLARESPRHLVACVSLNTLVAWATAAELPHVELGDSLALVLLALDHDAPRFDKAAVRWHARFCREAALTSDESQLALAA